MILKKRFLNLLVLPLLMALLFFALSTLLSPGAVKAKDYDKGDFIVQANNDKGFSFKNGVLTINKDAWDITVKNKDITKATTNRIVINADVTPATTLVLAGVNMSYTGTDAATYSNGAIELLANAAGGANMTITLAPGTTNTIFCKFSAAIQTDTFGSQQASVLIGSLVDNPGSLEAKAGGFGAAIGGARSESENDFNTCKGDVSIVGGKIRAESALGAGIGGGYKSSGKVYITGGEVEAYGGDYSAGIGGGKEGDGTVKISGGKVKAKGGDNDGQYAASIGSGFNKDGNVLITGGNVTALIGYYGTAIGGIKEGSTNSKVTITGGTVQTPTSDGKPAHSTRKSMKPAPTNGQGQRVYLTTLKGFTPGQALKDAPLLLKGYTFNATADAAKQVYGNTNAVADTQGAFHLYLPNTLGGTPVIGNAGMGNLIVDTTVANAEAYTTTLAPADPLPLNLDNYTGDLTLYNDGFTVGSSPKIAFSGSYSLSGGTEAAPLKNRSVYVADGYTGDNGRQIILNGLHLNNSASSPGAPGIGLMGGATATLGLASGSTNTLVGGADHAGLETAGTSVLTLDGTAENPGSLKATGGTSSAGIGGGNNSGGRVIINGGDITGIGGSWGAGIGGGSNTSGQATLNGGNITINGGKVTGIGGTTGAGIGGGAMGSSQVSINGGTVVAEGSALGAGIGNGGFQVNTSAVVTITGGHITSQAKDGGAGIGGCTNGVATVNISGGTIVATGGSTTNTIAASGIGNGSADTPKSGGSVTITGGSITAAKGSGASQGADISPAPLNGSSLAVYKAALNPGTQTDFSGLKLYKINQNQIQEGIAYGLKDLAVENGVLTLYLPENGADADGQTSTTALFSGTPGIYTAIIKAGGENAFVNRIEKQAIGATPPIAGQAPDKALSLPQNAPYTAGNVKWTGPDGKEVSGSFEGGKAYTLSFTLTPSTGYGFSAGTTAVVNGKTDTHNTFNADSTLTVSQSFSAEAATYTLSLSGPDPATGFAKLTYGYTTGSTAAYTLKNTGNSTQKGIMSTLTNNQFTASFASGFTGTLAPGGEVRISLTSAAGLNAGITTDTLTLASTENVQGVSVELRQEVAKAINPAPAVQGHNEVLAGDNDGKITGLDAAKAYEYKADGALGYTAVEVGAQEITGLAPGIYHIRFVEDANHTSTDSTITIATGEAKTYTIALTKTDPEGGLFADLIYGYTTSGSVTYTITNTGNSPIADLAATLADGTAFEITQGEALSLDPNISGEVVVTTKGGLNAADTPYTDTLHIASTAHDSAVARRDDLSQKIAKALPKITAAPKAAALKLGQTLGDSDLTEGAANVDGAFAWTTPALVPAQGEGQSFEAIFTPVDSDNYQWVAMMVLVDVVKDKPVPDQDPAPTPEPSPTTPAAPTPTSEDNAPTGNAQSTGGIILPLILLLSAGVIATLWHRASRG